MAVSSGFFNSLNHDRLYDAEQFGSIFDGIIVDGVLMTIGNKFSTRPGNSMSVIVGSGRAWFDHSWIYNDSDLLISVPLSNSLLTRIDMICIETNWEDTVRKNDIKLIQGTPASSPVRPTPVRSSKVNQYPIAFITIPAGATSLTAGNIAITVGSSACPFATAPLEKVSIDELFAVWEASYQDWMYRSNQAFSSWFSNIQTFMEGDVAANLTAKVQELNDKVDTIPEVVRVDKDPNDLLPGANRIAFHEVQPKSGRNLPTQDAWYHVYTSQGSDVGYAVQLAMSMTKGGGTYQREKQPSGWTSWKMLTNKNHINEYRNVGTSITLEQFVAATAAEPRTAVFQFRDSNNIMGLGTDWVKGFITYQNTYSESYDCCGIGFVSRQADILYKLVIRGSISSGYTAYTTPMNDNIGMSTQSVNGLMSAADKKKLDGISAGANFADIKTVDIQLTGTLVAGGVSVSLSGKAAVPSGYKAFGIGGWHDVETQEITWSCMKLSSSQGDIAADGFRHMGAAPQAINIRTIVTILCYRTA